MYDFATKDLDLNNAFSAGESESGDLRAARQLVSCYGCQVELLNPAGFVVGMVYRDGSYRLFS